MLAANYASLVLAFYRLKEAPLRPVYDVYPVGLSDQALSERRNAIGAVLSQAGVQLGEFNAEGFFTPEGRFFILEINPRQAGHYNPQDIKMYCGVDLTRLLITTAVGDMTYYKELKTFRRERNHVLSYLIFSSCDGILDRVYVDSSLSPYMQEFRFLHGQKEGDFVQNIHEAVRPIAKTVFRFDTADDLEAVRKRITELVYPIMR